MAGLESSMARRKVRVGLGFACLAVMAACGGGGGDSAPPPPPPGPPPPPAVIDAVTSVETPASYSVEQLSAFNRLNEIRAQAELGLLASDGRLDSAAIAHASWEVGNGLFSHVEQSGTPGYTGDSFYQRDQYAGYQMATGGEVLAAGLSPVGSVDLLASAFYHRMIVLAPQLVDVGLGWSDSPIAGMGRPLVMNIAIPAVSDQRGNGQGMRSGAGGLSVWPARGATGVYTHMGPETPNPCPDLDVRGLGMPISVRVNRWQVLQLQNLKLHDDTANGDVPIRIMTSDSDPAAMVTRDYVGGIPLAALAKDHLFSVIFQGLVDGKAISTNWQFSTGSVDYQQ